jgi:hypothetical protein
MVCLEFFFPIAVYIYEFFSSHSGYMSILFRILWLNQSNNITRWIQLWSSSLSNFLHFHVNSSVLDPL